MIESPYRAGELLQTSATISAIALALAALSVDHSPEYKGAHPLAIVLLLGGYLALAGSLYAMVDLWDEVGLSLRDLAPRRLPYPLASAESEETTHTFAQSAMIVTTWGLLVIGIAYLVLLIIALP